MRSAQNDAIKDECVRRILRLMEAKGINQNDLIKHLGLPNGTFTRWKYNDGKSYLKYLAEISEYLGVTSDFILYGEDMCPEIQYSSTEKDIIQILKKLTEHEQSILLDVANTLILERQKSVY